MCQVDLARPFDQQEYIAPPGSARQFHLIFVTTASLEASLNLIRDQIDAKDRAKANGGPRPARVVKEEDQAAQFFFDTMNASPGERTVDKAELERQALQRWPDLGKNALRRARAKAIALGKGRFTAWGEGGKPAGQN